MENFITNIYIKKSRNVEDLELSLSDSERKHIIITGKNGSGKTSLLLEIVNYLKQFYDSHLKKDYDNIVYELEERTKQFENTDFEGNESLKYEHTRYINYLNNELKQSSLLKFSFSSSKERIHQLTKEEKFIIRFFNSKRKEEFLIPNSIGKVNSEHVFYDINYNANQIFLEYLVNLKAEKSFANDDKDIEAVKKIDIWFKNFEDKLKEIFNDDSLKLVFNRKELKFEIVTDNKEVFDFKTLSDGYSAIISIVSELLIRMKTHDSNSFDTEGIVIIDEIETHLHVDLQKKILPFLITFFPKIQFIVTTHSPFVLSSISNSVICDLEKKIVTNDLTGYSYDAILESYFDTDKYSEYLKDKIKDIDLLISQKTYNKIEVFKLLQYLESLPNFYSKELELKILEIKTELLTKD